LASRSIPDAVCVAEVSALVSAWMHAPTCSGVGDAGAAGSSLEDGVGLGEDDVVSLGEGVGDAVSLGEGVGVGVGSGVVAASISGWHVVTAARTSES